MNTTTHEVWFACEFYSNEAPKAGNKDWISFENQKFFHKKEDAIKHAYSLALSNLNFNKENNNKANEYKQTLFDKGIDGLNVDSFNELAKQMQEMPYLLVDKFDVKGDISENPDRFFMLSCYWQEKGAFMSSTHQKVVETSFDEEAIKNNLASFCAGKYAHENAENPFFDAIAYAGMIYIH